MTTNDILKDYIIYKIYCKNKEITDEYYGHTSAFRQRKCKHKECCNYENNRDYNTEKYKIIRSNGGWDNWEMVPIEEIKNCSLINAKIREQFHIDLNKSKLNKNKSYITEEQRLERDKENSTKYRKNNRDQILEYQTDYRNNNKEYIREFLQNYYKNNKEVITEKHKRYYENNKKIILENQKEYREKNSEKISEKAKEKMTCSCGSTFRIRDKSQHEKSKKHYEFISKQLN
tara:strand:+ start:13 stop:705 length:693 start_codon:yes stop_codon:yes gene_type:complete